jgi:cytochrome c oxidase assembly protein subunit 15
VWQLGVVRLQRLVTATLVVLGLEVVVGVVLAYLALPAVAQPVHLTLATVLFGTQFLTLLGVARQRNVPEKTVFTGAPHAVVA